jgi:hypothetical protein
MDITCICTMKSGAKRILVSYFSYGKQICCSRKKLMVLACTLIVLNFKVFFFFFFLESTVINFLVLSDVVKN